MIKIIESPREGMQGFPRMIPAGEKISYLNRLLRVGFDTVETGSVVSSRIIPQMADSLDVLKQLDLAGTSSNIMFLAVNTRGAEQLAHVKEITHISYPFSLSPTFLELNVRSTVEQSLETAKFVTGLCKNTGKQAVIYISMAFGNPYGDPWNVNLLAEWVGKLYEAGARIIPLSNVSIEIDVPVISEVFSTLIPMFPDVEFGLHLHTTNRGWHEKADAAYSAGCRRFDGVISGLGGCPMTGKEMLGNLDTGNLIAFAEEKEEPGSIDKKAWEEARMLARKIFK
ncbi:MAG: hydroxymethylglutaryl-CoA lyase [Bacteroidota bacterium]